MTLVNDVVDQIYKILFYACICYATYDILLEDYVSSYIEHVDLDNIRSRIWVTNKD